MCVCECVCVCVCVCVCIISFWPVSLKNPDYCGGLHKGVDTERHDISGDNLLQFVLGSCVISCLPISSFQDGIRQVLNLLEKM